MTAKKIRRVVGDVVKIALNDGALSYGAVLPSSLFVFFDYHSTEEADVSEVVRLPVLFRVFVMHKAVTSGRWQVVGHVELDEKLLQSPAFCKQDAIKKDKFYLYIDGKEIPSTREECQGLERAAVWDPTHVEDRLVDHYANRPNKWVESLKIKD